MKQTLRTFFFQQARVTNHPGGRPKPGFFIRFHKCAWLRIAPLVVLFVATALPPVAEAANTIDNYTGAAAGSLNVPGNWSLGSLPTVSNDAVFPTGAATGIRTLSAANLTVGSLDVQATSGTFSIRNETTLATDSILTLGGAGNTGNSVIGTAAADLLWVASGATLNLIGPNGSTGTGVLKLVLGQSGNFNIAGTATFTTSISGSGFGFTKTGGGTLTLNASNTYSGGTILSAGTLRAIATGSLGSGTVTLSGGTLTLLNDGNGTGSLENISYGNNVTVGGAATITVGQFTALAPGTSGANGINAANKTLQLGALSIGAFTLTETSANGFGLEFTGPTTLTGSATFSVGGGNNTPIVQGLTLSGVVSGAFGFTKSGAGTLVLNNSGNTFGSASTINITAGLVSVTSDGALGAANNIVSLNASGAGLQANGTFSIAHQINTSTAGGVIDVTQGNIATMTTAFNGGASSANAFSKNGNGILEISANNSGGTPYTGAITVNAGAIRVSNAGALGATANNTTVANNIGAAVQLNGVSTAELFTLNNSGINSGGALQAVGGASSTASGVITLASGTTLGADTSSTLNITGGMSGNQSLTLAGAGNINFTTTALTPNFGSITKIGSGTATLSVAATAFANALTVNAGTFKMDGTAQFSNASSATVNPGATLTLDNTTTSTANRLSNGSTTRTLTLTGGTFNFIGNTTTESLGNLVAGGNINGLSKITTSGSGTSTLTFSGFSMGNVNGNNYLFNIGSGTTVKFTTTTGFLDSNGLMFGNSSGSGSRGDRFYVGDGSTSLEFAVVDGSGNIAAYNYTGANSTANPDLGNLVNTIPGSGNTNIKPTGTQSTITGTGGRIGGVKLTGGVGITLAQGARLTFDGALINLGGGNITGGFIDAGGTREMVIGYATDGTINSILGWASGNNLSKLGAGNLTLTAINSATGNLYVNQGTVTLAGGNNTWTVNQGLVVNNGATLDLQSNNQYVGSLSSAGLVEGSGGTITGTGGTLTIRGNASTFSGNIAGTLNVTKVGTAAGYLTLTSANTTSGSLNIIGSGAGATATASGGGVLLKDGGSLSSIGSIAIRNSGLVIDNTGTKDMSDRVRDGAAIIMDGGRIDYLGRVQFNSTETLGPVTANTGVNTFTVEAGGTGVNSAQLNLTSLTRNTGATLSFSRAAASANILGLIGNNPRITIGTAPTLVGGIIPGATSSQLNGTGELVSYVQGLGVGQLGIAGFPGYYTGAIASAGLADNVKLTGSQSVNTGGQTVNSWTTSGNLTINFAAASDILTLASGMYFSRGTTDVIGSTGTRGVLTSSYNNGMPGAPNELFVIEDSSGGSVTVNSVIANNGGQAVMAIFSGKIGATPTITLTAANTYTGGTKVNGGYGSRPTLSLNATTGGSVVIPTGGLTINDAIVTEVTNRGQINSSNVVTLNGRGQLTLIGGTTGGTGAGSEVLAGLTFNSNGDGAGAPTVTIPTSTFLTITGDITSNPSNVTVTPIISGGTLDLNGSTAHNITVSALTEGNAVAASASPAQNLTAQNGLQITSIIQNGGFTKKGTGVLNLTGNNTFTGDLTVEEGVLNVNTFNASAAAGPLGQSANPIIMGGVGNKTGTIEYAGGSVSSARNFSMASGGTGAFQVDVAANTLTLTGTISGSGGLGKTGPGTVTLSGTTANTYGGNTTINNGTLKIGNANNMIPNTSTVVINSGTYDSGAFSPGTLDLNGFDETIDGLQGNSGTVLGQVVNNANGSGTKTLTVGASGGSASFAGIIKNNNITSGTGLIALTKTGSGTQALSGANTYTGATAVNQGTLLIDGNMSLAIGTVTVNSGGTLGGIGTVGGATTVLAGGKLSPGDSPGTLTIANNLDISGAVAAANSQSMLFELVTPRTSDQVLLTGTFALSIGSGVLEFNDFAFSGTPTLGTYTLFDTSAVINGFLGANLTGTVGGYTGTLTLADSNHDIILTLTSDSAIPEPSTFMLWITALVMGGVAYQRSRKNKNLAQVPA